MSTDPDASDVTRRRFLAVAGSAIAAGSVVLTNPGESAEALPPPPTNPNTYTITVDVSNNSFVYTATDASNKSVTANPLTVNNQDLVYWKIKSKGSKHNAAIHFKQDTPFGDNGFNWNEQDENPGGSHAHGGQIQKTPYEDYDYSIAVYDPDANQLYLDDPTIIVGGDGMVVRAAIIQATNELRAVDSKIQSIEQTLSKALGQSKSKAVHESNKK